MRIHQPPINHPPITQRQSLLLLSFYCKSTHYYAPPIDGALVHKVRRLPLPLGGEPGCAVVARLMCERMKAEAHKKKEKEGCVTNTDG